MMSGAGKATSALARWPSPPSPPSGPLSQGDPRQGRSAEPAYRLTQGKQGLDWQLSGKLTLANWQLTHNKGRNLPASSSWR